MAPCCHLPPPSPLALTRTRKAVIAFILVGNEVNENIALLVRLGKPVAVADVEALLGRVILVDLVSQALVSMNLNLPGLSVFLRRAKSRYSHDPTYWLQNSIACGLE